MIRSFLLATAALAVALPAHSAPNLLQWRDTTCQVQESGEIVGRGRCIAGFAYDTAIRAVKFRNSDGTWVYHQVGGDGVSFAGLRECLSIDFDDGTTQTVCTVQTPEQLRIQGD